METKEKEMEKTMNQQRWFLPLRVLSGALRLTVVVYVIKVEARSLISGASGN
jgi:hypothetical protein